MDWVDGTDLARILAERGAPGLAPSSVVAYLAEAAEALTSPARAGPADRARRRQAREPDPDPRRTRQARRLRAVVHTADARAPLGNCRATGPPSSPPAVPAVARERRLLAGRDGLRAAHRCPAERRAAGLGGNRPGAGGAARDRHPPGAGDRPGATPGHAGRARRAAARRMGRDAPDRRDRRSACRHRGLDGAVGARSRRDGGARSSATTSSSRDAVEAHGGRFLKSKGEGDATFSVFESAPDAVEAAIAADARARRRDVAERPARSRSASGSTPARPNAARCDYFGPTVNVAARVRGQADGGEILLSQLTADLSGDHLPAGYVARRPRPPPPPGRRGDRRRPRGRRPRRDAPLPATECPYRGLLAFDAERPRRFFGREDVVALGPRAARTEAAARARRRVRQREVLGAARRRDRRGRRRRGRPGRGRPAAARRARSRARRSTATPRRSSSSTSSRSCTRSATTPTRGGASSTRCSPPGPGRDRHAGRLLRRAERASRPRRRRGREPGAARRR